MDSLILKYIKVEGKTYFQGHMCDMQMNVYAAFYPTFIVTVAVNCQFDRI